MPQIGSPRPTKILGSNGKRYGEWRTALRFKETLLIQKASEKKEEKNHTTHFTGRDGITERKMSLSYPSKATRLRKFTRFSKKGTKRKKKEKKISK